MRPILLAILCLYSLVSVGQIRPVENDTLNYRMIGFLIPVVPGVDNNIIEIARGRINNNYDFDKNIIMTHKDSGHHFILTLPEFGQDYTWRISYSSKKKPTKEKPALHHFTVGKNAFLDTARYRYKIVDKAAAYRDLLVFMDNSRTLIDLDGNAYWYLPETPGLVDSTSIVRDLKLSPHGTITFVTGKKAYEIDFDGNVLWKGPDDGQVSRDTAEFYHHELTRLRNGNYMVLGNEYITRRIPNIKDPSIYNNEWNVVTRDGEYFKTIECGTVIEYDTAGKVVWSWRSSDYLTDADYFSRTMPNGTLNTVTHLNGFYFDENNTIHVSFRDLNRIVQIDYPSGKVLKEYGESYKPERAGKASPFFGQHTCRVDKTGRLLLYNNNFVNGARAASNSTSVSSIMILTPQAIGGDNEVAWEFPCNIDTLAKPCNPTGGGVEQLNDGSFLVCMGVVNRCFIVTSSKKVTWNMLAEKKQGDGSWIPFESYRAAPASKSTIYQLITKQLDEQK